MKAFKPHQGTLKSSTEKARRKLI